MATFPAELRTDRMFLRRATLEDAAGVFAYASNAETAKYMTFRTAASLNDVTPYLESIQEPMNLDREFHWAMHHADMGTMMGIISARRIHGLELGYCLNQDNWGHGYMAEAANAIIKWAQVNEPVQRIWATCDIENDKSAALLRKIGMEEEGVLRKWALHPNLSATPRDCRVFSLL
jgi:ribosomal-protein-alanine N-acetyltransferase